MSEQKINKLPHNIIMNSCSKLTLTGVTDVGSFDENAIYCYTSCGRLSIKGENLKVESVDTQVGDMEVSGKVCSLVYSDEVKRRTLMSKLFK